ncbi:MAG: hypothetical protein CR988_02725 [Treponema sp.]|nr:MAG: hypothetical protein CR988_02725 [Treponema sp.]
MKVSIKGKIVFIPIEVKNREYKAKLLLANYFLNEGYSVAIGSIWHMDPFLSDAKNSIYITKDFYKYRYPFLSQLHENNNFIVGWDEEGLIYDSDEYYITTALNESTLNTIDMIITWGERQKRTIKKFINKNPNQLLPLGNPRLDLLKLDIAKKVFKSEVSYINANFGYDYILINSNFNIATRDDYDGIKAAVNCNGKNEKGVELIQKLNKLTKALAPVFFLAVKHIAERFPSKKIIFRPHPAEDIKTIKNIFKDYNNIYVEKKFAVNPWLVGASIIIHSGCTTGMEAAMMGKNVISYQPDIGEAYIDTVPDRLSKIVRSEDELLNILESYVNEKKILLSDKQKNILHDYVDIDENKTCSKKIIDSIKIFKSKSENSEFVFNTSISKYWKVKNIKPFNIEFGALNYEEFHTDLINIKKAMSFDYKDKIFFLTEHVFFIANRNSEIKFKLNFKRLFTISKKIVKKIFK